MAKDRSKSLNNVHQRHSTHQRESTRELEKGFRSGLKLIDKKAERDSAREERTIMALLEREKEEEEERQRKRYQNRGRARRLREAIDALCLIKSR